MYVGYTKNNIEYRLKQHIKKSVFLNTKLSKAILKYGYVNFIIEPILTTQNKNEAIEKEIYYIEKLDTFKSGYNSTLGGDGGDTMSTKKHSEETKVKISKNHSDVKGVKNPFFGKKHSEETKKKIANRNYKKGSNHHLYGKTTKTSFKEGKEHPKAQSVTINGVEYGSLTLASKFLKMSRQTIKKRYLNDE